tara:strand:- start:531 stop:713 length:183 start_codon:yes stop_codon:yes gene_type:complete
MKFKPGDYVTMSNMWKYDIVWGTVDKVTPEYVVVKWDNIPGYWHYTEEQAKKLELTNVAD